MADPSPVEDAAEAARARDQAEEQARLLYAAALGYVVAHDPGEEPSHDARLMKAAAVVALVLLRHRQRVLKTAALTGEARQRWLDDQATVLARRAAQDAREHYKTVSKRVLREDPDASDRLVDSTVRGDKAWSAAAARTMATRAAAEAAMSLHPAVEAATGEPHSKLWISRGDPKVRKSHRTLHGRVREFGDSFLPDDTLNFPGDPRAPLDEILNCRCHLWLVPTAEKAKAEAVFSKPSSDFDVPMGPDSAPVAASAVPFEVGRAERELRSELSRQYTRIGFTVEVASLS